MKICNFEWNERGLWILAILLAIAAPAFSKRRPSQQTAPQPESSANAKAGSLDQVLRRMDENAAKFRSAQADFVWTPYNSVINETESPDKGRIYFRKVGNEIQMAATIQPPDDRQIVFSGGKVQVYQPKTRVLDIYDAGAHKDEVETFLVLGFGSSGEDLRKSFEVTYLGDEKIGTVQTGHLQLTPLAEKVKRSFPRIDLGSTLRDSHSANSCFRPGGTIAWQTTPTPG